MIKIYHNPRCSKSRQGLALLEESGKEYEVIKYLEDNLSQTELTSVISKLGVKPLDLVRKNEAIWKSNYKGQDLSDAQLIEIMVANPKLIERPIVVNDNTAIIGRPPSLIKEII